MHDAMVNLENNLYVLFTGYKQEQTHWPGGPSGRLLYLVKAYVKHTAQVDKGT